MESMKQTRFLVFVLFAALALSACSKKTGTANSADPKQAGTPSGNNPQPTPGVTTVINGKWATDCQWNEDLDSYQIEKVQVVGDVLTYTKQLYANDDSECTGSSRLASDPFTAKFRITPNTTDYAGYPYKIEYLDLGYASSEHFKLDKDPNPTQLAFTSSSFMFWKK